MSCNCGECPIYKLLIHDPESPKIYVSRVEPTERTDSPDPYVLQTAQNKVQHPTEAGVDRKSALFYDVKTPERDFRKRGKGGLRRSE